ncbi:hypothetical protein C1I98_10965 [Spongiactinospora gelatinilytica]|uniref:Uncharacterized protein n=2 Tax=Spongiactinospora gelatinilytica TaxID=2666298 RepID=A0A2W2H4Q3_9ACTN|nr:hypothetical protein C1I98_10965 [Spongiactinospora gelatinilytica]
MPPDSTPNSRVNCDASDESHVIERMIARVNRINTLARWQQQVHDHSSGEQARLIAELEEHRAELAAARVLIAALYRERGADPEDLPPRQLGLAWHAQAEYRPVEVDVDGVPATIVRYGAPRDLEPIREAHEWEQMKQVIRSARAFARGEAE